MAITRSDVLRRAHAVPLGSDPYNQKIIDDSGANAGYRRDCSGFVSYCWYCPTSRPGTWGGYNTATFVTQGVMHEIPRSKLRPGDAIGRCGKGSPGHGGHIALWLGPDLLHVLDHASGMGPKNRQVSHTWLSGYKAWRFNGIVEDDGTTYPHDIGRGDDMLYFGHGYSGPEVVDLQMDLLALGVDLGESGADGVYGDRTATALLAAIAPWIGGDPTGKTFGPGERQQLKIAMARRFGGGGAASDVHAP